MENREDVLILRWATDGALSMIDEAEDDTGPTDAVSDGVVLCRCD